MVFQFRLQKPQKLKVLKTIDFAGLRKDFLENISLKTMVFLFRLPRSPAKPQKLKVREATRSYAKTIDFAGAIAGLHKDFLVLRSFAYFSTFSS